MAGSVEGQDFNVIPTLAALLNATVQGSLDGEEFKNCSSLVRRRSVTCQESQVSQFSEFLTLRAEKFHHQYNTVMNSAICGLLIS